MCSPMKSVYLLIKETVQSRHITSNIDRSWLTDWIIVDPLLPISGGENQLSTSMTAFLITPRRRVSPRTVVLGCRTGRGGHWRTVGLWRTAAAGNIERITRAEVSYSYRRYSSGGSTTENGCKDDLPQLTAVDMYCGWSHEPGCLHWLATLQIPISRIFTYSGLVADLLQLSDGVL